VSCVLSPTLGGVATDNGRRLVNPPTLAEAAPRFAEVVEIATRKKSPILADQIAELRVATFCDCKPRCSAFTIDQESRPQGKVTTTFVMNTADTGFVLADAIDDVVVGLDVFDDGQLREEIESFIGHRRLD
jgi:hypothetical protein